MRPYGIGILDEIVAIKSRPPTSADDIVFGYQKGQFWINDALGTCYQCLNHLPAGGAVWIEISGGGGGGSFVWQGTWSASTTYVVNDVVAYNNGSYIATAVSNNQLPTSGPPYWDTLAAPGSGISQADADLRYRMIGSYIHNQGVASSVWTITHNLGTYPGVIVKDSTGAVVETDIEYLSLSVVRITAASPFSGQAILT